MSALKLPPASKMALCRERQLMISLSRKFVFIHIPRCAGTSIESVLRPFCEPLQARSSWREPYSPKHYTIQQYESEYDLTGFYRFAFVRHPLTRMLSIYRWGKEIAQAKKGIGWQSKTFDDWIASPEWRTGVKVPEPESSPAPAETATCEDEARSARIPLPIVSLEPEHEMAPPEANLFVLPPSDKLQVDWLNGHVDMIGKFETLEKDWKTIATRIDVQSFLPKLHGTYDTTALSLGSMDAIFEYFRRDFEAFGYEMG